MAAPESHRKSAGGDGEPAQESLSSPSPSACEQIGERADRTEEQTESQKREISRSKGARVAHHPDGDEDQAEREIHEEKLGRLVRPREHDERRVTVAVDRIERRGGESDEHRQQNQRGGAGNGPER